MAVNNLLSRDDEGEPSHGTSGGDNGVVSGALGGSDDWYDESISLLSFLEDSEGHVLFDPGAIGTDDSIEPTTSPRRRGDASEYG